MRIYQTGLGNLSTVVSVDGVPVRIHFVSSDGRTGYFSTDDRRVQQALEQSRGYGKRFGFFRDAPEVELSEPERKKLMPIRKITGWQQAREFLHQPPYSIGYDRLDTPYAIEREAEMQGIYFPKLKK